MIFVGSLLFGRKMGGLLVWTGDPWDRNAHASRTQRVFSSPWWRESLASEVDWNTMKKTRNTLLVQAVMAAMLFAGNLIWNEVHCISYQDMHYYNMAFSGIFLGLALGLLLQNRNRAEQ